MTAVDLEEQAARDTDATPPESLATDEPPMRRRGPNPIVVIGAAFVVGVVLAKVLDSKSRADAGD